ncbi:MAG: hypothetical protein M3319_13680 [Actinomycetota bacterium]|nr:hypothetical protein [Actinomycetota bacterium]MDQ3901433.1 hypothetical protein [Actinomycetota bacterium]
MSTPSDWPPYRRFVSDGKMAQQLRVLDADRIGGELADEARTAAGYACTPGSHAAVGGSELVML